jgi:DNA-binding protein YbaB
LFPQQQVQQVQQQQMQPQMQQQMQPIQQQQFQPQISANAVEVKKMPKGALFGIIGGVVAVIAAAVIIVVNPFGGDSNTGGGSSSSRSDRGGRDNDDDRRGGNSGGNQGNSNVSIVGTWTCTCCGGETFTATADGKILFEGYEATYTISGNTITMTMFGETFPTRFRINGDILTLTDEDGDVWEYRSSNAVVRSPWEIQAEHESKGCWGCSECCHQQCRGCDWCWDYDCCDDC